MKNQSFKEEFIRLHALGVSYDKIAKAISVSKPTLLKWAQESSDQIAAETEVKGFRSQSKSNPKQLIQTLINLKTSSLNFLY